MTGRASSDTPSPARRRAARRVRVVVLACAGIVGLAIAEVAVRPFTPREIIGPSAVRHDPVYRRALIPGYRGTVHNPGVSYPLSVNAMGFRGPDPAAPLDGCVLFLGDSFTFGDGVDDGVEYPQIIARRLTDQLSGAAPAVINAALAGEGQGRWLKILDLQAPNWNPSCVVLQVCANDFRDNQVDGMFTLGPDGSLVEEPVPQESTLRALQRTIEGIPLIGYSRLYCLAKRGVGILTHRKLPAGIPSDFDTESTPFDDLTIAMIRSALQKCTHHGWPPVGVTAQLEPGARLDLVRAEFERFGAPVIVVPTKAERPDLHLVGDDHWNDAGHRFVAAALGPAIDRAIVSGGSPAHGKGQQ